MISNRNRVTQLGTNSLSGWRIQIAAFLLYFLIVVTYQWVSHAYTVAFEGYADEPAHYLTSVMVRDYILSGFKQSPLAFAEQYYVHYPAVAFGMWGPMLHILGGLWMVLFSDSRVSILMLIALIAAGFAWSTQWIVMRSFRRPLLGVLSGLAVCLIPIFQEYSVTVMADILTSILVFGAGYYWYRYLQTGTLSMSLRFGIFTILALLTKANAGALALVPLPATLLAGRGYLMRRFSFWAPFPIIVLVAGPWYVFYTWLMANITRVPLTQAIATSYVLQILGIFSLWTIPVVLGGMVSGFFRNTPGAANRDLWAVAVATSLGFIVYYCAIQGGFDTRYALMPVPWVAILFILGAEWINEAWLPARSRVVAMVLVGAVVVYGLITCKIYPKGGLEYAQVVSELLPRRDMPQSVFMISTELAVETTLVAEIAMRDRRPNHFVLRASKMLAKMNWNGNLYENKISDLAQIGKDLTDWGVSRVIIDTTPGPVPWIHHRLLRKFVASDREWKLTRQIGPVEVYEFQGTVKLPDKIVVDVPYTLRRTLEASTGK